MWYDERTAATSIQRLWRGYNARKYIAYLHDQATEIERVWRGYVGRNITHVRSKIRKTHLEKKFFDAMATVIQKIYRGYRSRKDKQDFYGRKDYVATVTKKSAVLNQHITRNIANLNDWLEDKRVVEEAKEFTELTENLHHLLGTRNRPGVFRSAIGPEFHTTAYGVPLEDHIVEAFENRQEAQRRQGYLDKQQKLERRSKKQTRAMKQIQQAQILDREIQNNMSSTKKHSKQPRAARAPPTQQPLSPSSIMVGYPPPMQQTVYSTNPNNNGTLPRRRAPTPPQLKPIDQRGVTQTPNGSNIIDATIMRPPRLVPMAN